MIRERIIIDMDEVICDTLGGMIDWYSKEYAGEINMEKMLAGSWLKGFPEQHHALIRERLYSQGFFRRLPVIRDSVNVVRELNQRYEVFIVSAAMEFPNSLKDKADWLFEHFPFLTWRQLTLCGDKRVVHGDHMIDDLVRNFEFFNGKKYLFSAAHNLTVTGYQRLNNWEDAARVFLK
jgi:5'-nucleotidase